MCISHKHRYITRVKYNFDQIPISKDGLTIFTNYPSLTKDQVLEKTVLTLFHPVVCGCFQPVIVAIEDTIARHNVIKG